MWIKYETWDAGTVVIPTTVSRFKRFLPRGPVADGEAPSYDGIRETDLVQFWTDPGGLRTVAVADIHFKDPRNKE